MIESCWYALLEKLSLHSTGNKLTHTCTAQYHSNPQLLCTASGAVLPVIAPVQIGCKPIDLVTDHVMQEVSRACQTVRQQ